MLRPVGILCKVLQEDELCIIRTVESFMKTKKALDEMKSKGFEDLVTVKKVDVFSKKMIRVMSHTKVLIYTHTLRVCHS